MHRKERSRSLDRGDEKRLCLQTETTELDMQSAVEHHVQEMKNQCLKDEQPPENYVPPLGKETLDASDFSTFPLMPVAMDFLQGERQVMLLMGDAGSGKTHFLRQLERKLWEFYNGPNDSIPIFINLPEFSKTAPNLLKQVLKSKGYNKHLIRHLKSNKRRFILLCDRYDESKAQGNIYNCNNLNKPGQWRAKLIFACRSYKLGPGSDGHFRPEDRYSLTKRDLFQKVAMAPFTLQEIKHYVRNYVTQRYQAVVRPSSEDTQEVIQREEVVQRHSPEVLPSNEGNRVWSVPEYMETLTSIPNLIELVGNPYILSFVLGLLPDIVGSARDNFQSRISFDVLYKYVFDHWINVSQQRLFSRDLSQEERAAFDELLEDGFQAACMAYLKDLAIDIFKNQKKDVNSIHYTFKNDKTTWKAKFFGSEAKTRLLQESVPLARSGTSYYFIHPSLLDYLYPLVMFDLDASGEDFIGSDTDGSDSDDTDWGTPNTLSGSNADPPLTEQASQRGQALESGHALGVTNIAKRPMAVQILADRVQNNPFFKEQLIETVRQSRNSDSVDHRAANAMTILVRSGMQFHSADLRGIKIKGANLTGGGLDSADLRDSDLTGAILEKCCLSQARLEGARLRGARFGELPFVELSRVPTISAYSLDGRLYAVGFINGSITILDAASWKPVHTYQESKRSITALAFSPRGELLAFGTMTGLVKTWDYTNNTLSTPFGEHEDYISSLVYSLNGHRIATASQDGRVGIWNAASGELIMFIDAHHGGVTSVALSPDGKQLVSGGFDNILRLWNLETGVLVSTLEGHDGAISQVLFSPDGLKIASSSSDNTVRTWFASAGTWGLEMICRGHTERVTSIVYSPTGRHFASCSDDSTVRMWDARNGSPGPVFRGHTDQIVSIAFSLNGMQLVSCGRDKALRIWDCRSAVKGGVSYGSTNTISSGIYPHSTVWRHNGDNDKAIQTTLPRPLACTFRSASFGTDVTSFAISPNGFLVASACNINNSPTVIVSYGTTNQHRHSLIGHRKKISSMAFSPDSERIVSGDDEGVLRAWNAESGESMWTQEEHGDMITSIAYASTGHQIVSGSNDGTVRLWDALTGDAVHVFDAKEGVQCVALSPSGRWIASGGEDGVVRLWDPNNVVPGAILNSGHESAVNSVAFSPDNVHIASAGDDSTFKIWNINTKTKVHVLEGHSGQVRCLAYSPSGEYIASGSDDSTLKIWDVGKGVLESTVEHDQGVMAVLYSLDGTQLLTGTNDYRVHCWTCAFGCQDTAIISTTAFSMDSQQVASSLGGKAVQLWDTELGIPGPTLYGHSAAIECVTFSPIGDIIATASRDSSVRIWETAKGGCIELLWGHTGIVTSVVFSPQGTQIATMGFDQTLRWWDFSLPDSGSFLNESHKLSDGIFVHDESGLFHSPVYSPDGKEISVISGQNSVLRFDAQTKTDRPALVGHSELATCVAYSPSGDRIATSSEDTTARIWDPVTGNESCKLEGHTGSVTSVAFSPLSYQLATSSADGTIRLWSVPVYVSNPEVVSKELLGHGSAVLCVSYSPGGKFLASGSADRTMRLWDTLSGDCLSVVGDFAASVKSIQWRATQGGMVLATGCRENPLQVWELVESLSDQDRQFEVRRRWGVGADALAVTGARIGQDHGLSAANQAFLEQRGTVFAA